MRYAWIRSQHGTYAARTLCRALQVSTSGYYAWLGRKPSTRAQDNARLGQRIAQLHAENREAYGTLRMWHALRQQGERCGLHRVQRLRQVNAIQSKRRRRYVRARSPYQRVPAAPNLLSWPFASPAPDRVWVADITFVPTRQGWLYLAAVLDVHTRRLVGWAMGERADQALASAALEMALTQRKPKRGAIHHSDQGVQYTCKAYQEHLQRSGLVPSMSRKGMPYDNAVMESFFSSLKHELTHHESFNSRDEARSRIFDYIELFYNRKRLHSTLGYRSPTQSEKMAMVPN